MNPLTRWLLRRFATCNLVDEVETREGVESFVIMPEAQAILTVAYARENCHDEHVRDGPARIFVIID